jgi:hypothetical protein
MKLLEERTIEDEWGEEGSASAKRPRVLLKLRCDEGGVEGNERMVILFRRTTVTANSNEMHARHDNALEQISRGSLMINSSFKNGSKGKHYSIKKVYIVLTGLKKQTDDGIKLKLEGSFFLF